MTTNRGVAESKINGLNHHIVEHDSYERVRNWLGDILPHDPVVDKITRRCRCAIWGIIQRQN
jgi:hypothetical protein